MSHCSQVVERRMGAERVLPDQRGVPAADQLLSEHDRALLGPGRADPKPGLKKKILVHHTTSICSGLTKAARKQLCEKTYASRHRRFLSPLKLLEAYEPTRTCRPSKPAGRTRVGDNERETRDISPLPQVPVGGPACRRMRGPRRRRDPATAKESTANAAPLRARAGCWRRSHISSKAPRRRERHRPEGTPPSTTRGARRQTRMIQTVRRGADVKKVQPLRDSDRRPGERPRDRRTQLTENDQAIEGLGRRNNHKCVSC